MIPIYEQGGGRSGEERRGAEMFVDCRSISEFPLKY
jgi:hypothetical protein